MNGRTNGMRACLLAAAVFAITGAEAQAKKASDIEAFIAEKGVTKCPPAGSGPLPHFLPGGPKRPPRILEPGERP